MAGNNLSVRKAAELMGVSPQYVRGGLQEKRLPFGDAVQISGSRYTYYISEPKFYEYIGVKKENE